MDDDPQALVGRRAGRLRVTKRVCAEPGCPELVERTAHGGRCTKHQRDRDRARGTKTGRGYGSTIHSTPLGILTFDQCRAAYRARQARGDVLVCTRCRQSITGSFDLGHDDSDRSIITGPEHPRCNRSAAGRWSPRPSK